MTWIETLHNAYILIYQAVLQMIQLLKKRSDIISAPIASMVERYYHCDVDSAQAEVFGRLMHITWGKLHIQIAMNELNMLKKKY